MGSAAPDLDIRPAWRLGDAGLEADAIAFWNRLGALPPQVAPEARAKELSAVAYREGQVIGVMTVSLQRIDFLRARFAMIRGLVDPAHRRTHAVSLLGRRTRELIERWSADHPDERVAGLGAIVESAELAAFVKQPIWPNTRLAVAGYTPDGRQIRVAWFEDFRLD